MTEPVHHVPLTAATTCAAPGCRSAPTYEVFLYDFYDYPSSPPEEFFQQDFTCPFLCEAHMLENEARAVGSRVPRGHVSYPFSNQHHAQGFTKYQPVPGFGVQLFEAGRLVDTADVRSAVVAVNEELLAYLARHPEALREIGPRKFEEVVAAIFDNQGFETTLTPATRDGGRDVQAVRRDSVGTLLYFVECKRYSPSRRVGVEVVRSLFGVVEQQRASVGVVATTSSFTADAIAFAEPLSYRLSLKDFDDLKEWLRTATAVG
jgi:hypothetical protein